ncbi:MAG: hypothetical protein D6813_08835 [Calditrichaeota bacterium]|nr:MAG: hypothetical protein D6813_08835 [Calditrichota bacterium]
MKNVHRVILNLVNKGRGLIPRRFSTRQAIGISLILHIFIAMAFASFLMQKYHPEGSPLNTSPLVFDLQTDTKVKFESQNVNQDLDNLTDGFNQPNEVVNNGFNGDAESAAGRASEALNSNNQDVVMASLASLSDLKDSFKFIMHQVSSDSLNGLNPIHGDMPDASYISTGNADGTGAGDGSGVTITFGGGGGHCPTGGIYR